MAWRRFLWRRWCTGRDAVRAARRHMSALWHWATTVTSSDLTRSGNTAMPVLSSAAVVLGQTLSVMSAPPGALRMEALFSSAVVMLSLVLGLAILVEASIRADRHHGPMMSAWFVGILPWSLALAPLLWPLAWAASFWLTRKVVSRSDLGQWALRAVGRAFGVQAVAGIVVWLVVNGLTVMLAG